MLSCAWPTKLLWTLLLSARAASGRRGAVRNRICRSCRRSNSIRFSPPAPANEANWEGDGCTEPLLNSRRDLLSHSRPDRDRSVSHRCASLYYSDTLRPLVVISSWEISLDAHVRSKQSNSSLCSRPRRSHTHDSLLRVILCMSLCECARLRDSAKRSAVYDHSGAGIAAAPYEDADHAIRRLQVPAPIHVEQIDENH